uniref:Uncharacterized protein n=1 Tax=Arundo donax TaxID=35708 RepID=A0A0A8Z0J7_ARUDO
MQVRARPKHHHGFWWPRHARAWFLLARVLEISD